MDPFIAVHCIWGSFAFTALIMAFVLLRARITSETALKERLDKQTARSAAHEITLGALQNILERHESQLKHVNAPVKVRQF